MIIHTLILFAVILLGIYISCYLCEYNITHTRKVSAAALFAGVSILPIPFILIVSFLALYVVLMDDSYERSKVNKVVLISYIFAFISIFVIYNI